jgi:subtilisin family serine protease
MVDSGILSTHSEFAGRVRAGFTRIVDGRGTEDCNGHGTHTAGIVGGATYGVAPKATLVPVRVTDCTGNGWTSDLIAGIDWAVADHQPGQPAVMNISMSGTLSSKVNDAVNRAIADGIVVVTAAGNNNKDACSYSPGSSPGAINVAASDEKDARWAFSNFGKCVDIFAPGTSILSAWNTSTTMSRSLKGTSHAAPHVTGAVALALQANPKMSVAEVTSLVIDSATSGTIADPGLDSPNRLLYALLTIQPAKQVIEIDNGVETAAASSFASLVVAKTAEGYEVSVDSSLAGLKVQISAVAKGKPTLTWTKTANSLGAVKFVTTRNLSGYAVAVLYLGAPYDSVKVL